MCERLFEKDLCLETIEDNCEAHRYTFRPSCTGNNANKPDNSKKELYTYPKTRPKHIDSINGAHPQQQ